MKHVLSVIVDAPRIDSRECEDPFNAACNLVVIIIIRTIILLYIQTKTSQVFTAAAMTVFNVYRWRLYNMCHNFLTLDDLMWTLTLSNA